MKFSTILIIALACVALGSIADAQPALLPSIGLSSLPSDDEPICSIPTYMGDVAVPGYNSGDIIPDFTLYTIDGAPVHIGDVMKDGKPLLLVAGSITCPVFRNRLPELNSVYRKFSDRVNIYLVYVVEAHPVTDLSPYSGKEWITAQNQNEGILLRQPTTYGERKALVQQTLDELEVLPEIIIDGPCNAWWQHFGPAPNNATLIRPDGKVETRHGWFNRAPQNMENDLTALIDGLESHDTTHAGGSFLFEVVGDTALSGSPNDILTAHGLLSNSSLEAVRIDMVRRINDLPSTWLTSICLDVCFPDFLDSTSLFLEPGASQDFSLYFYTTDNEGTGTVMMEFRNADEPQNSFRQVFTGTTGGTSVRGLPVAAAPSVTLYPNPALAGGDLYLAIESESPSLLTNAVLYSLDGRKLRTLSLAQGGATRIQTAGLPPGSYMMILSDRFGAVGRAGFILQ